MIDKGEQAKMKHWSFGKKKHLDEEKIAAQRDAERRIPDLIEFADEAELVRWVKTWNPKISPEKLREVIRLYHDAKRERALRQQSD